MSPPSASSVDGAGEGTPVPSRMDTTSNQGTDEGKRVHFGEDTSSGRPEVDATTGTTRPSAKTVTSTETTEPTKTTPARHSPFNSEPELSPPTNGAMPTDAEIQAQLERLIADGDLSTVTPRLLRESLEVTFGVSMKPKKGFIKETIQGLVQVKGEAEADALEASEGVEEDPTEGTAGKSTNKNSKKRTCRYGDVLSHEMAEFLGVERCPRTTVVKRLWAYIKENKLQDPKDGRKIIFDEALAKVFGENGRRKSMNMLTMNKLLTKHVRIDDGGYDAGTNAESDGDVVAKPVQKKAKTGSKERKPDVKAAKATSPVGQGPHVESSPAKPKKGMMQKELELSEDLQKLVGAPRMTRGGVTKQFWQYVKEHELLDPKDKRFVLSDELLEALTGKKRFKAFGFQKLFSRHMWEEGEVY